MNNQIIEKRLKHSLKKKISYSISLLISFLISGSPIQAANEGVEAQNKLFTKEELIRVSPEIEDPLIKDFLKDEYKVIFFYKDYENGRMKSNDSSNYRETIQAANAVNLNGKEEVIKGNGFIVDDSTYKERVFFTEPINTSDIGPINTFSKDYFGDVLVSIPQLTMFAFTSPAIETVSAPTGQLIGTLPTIPNLSFNTIIIPPLADIDPINVTPPTTNVPSDNDLGSLNINLPQTPGSYQPTAIIVPEEPTAPVIVSPTINLVNLATTSSGNGDGSWFWNTAGSNGVVSQVIMTSGTWTIDIAGSGTKDPWTGAITGYSASSPTDYSIGTITNQSYSGTSTGNNQAGIYRIVGSSASVFGVNTTVDINAGTRTGTNLRQFIHYDPHGDKAKAISSISDVTQGERDEARATIDKYAGTGRNVNSQILALRGSIDLDGNAMNIVGTQGHSVNGRDVFTLHNGTTTVNGNTNVIFAYTSAGDSTNRHYIVSNYDGGNITIEDGTGNFVALFDKGTGYNHIHSFKNDGTIDIQGGSQNVGIYLKQMANGGTLDLINPIIISGGSQNVGVVQNDETNNDLNTQSTARVDITGGTNNVGLYGKRTQTFSEADINLTGGTSSIAVMADTNNNTLTMGSNSDINISNSSGHIGLYGDKGNITYNGDINLSGGSDNKIAVAENGSNITIDGSVSVGDISGNVSILDSVPLYANGTSSNIVVTQDNLELNLNGDSIGLFTKDSGNITANRTTSPVVNIGSATEAPEPTIDPHIKVVGTTVASKLKGGIAFADSGGDISLQNTYMKITDGSSGLSVAKTGSSIDATGSILDYEGNAYAIYSDGDGTIDLTNGEIILRGSSTAFELDLDEPGRPIDLTNGRITVMSDDAIAINLKSLITSISTLESDINAATGGMTIVSGRSTGGTLYDKYKTAAIDGGILNIDEDLDKDATVGNSGYFYYRRFLNQRLVTNVLTNITVDATIDSAFATEYFKSQVVALEANSSSNAVSNVENQINTNSGSQIIADRTDSGDGAVGVFMNYGQLNLASGSTIEVEKGSNTVNDNAIGIFGVNGSEIDTNGSIAVGGDNSLGIVGMAYRTDSSDNPIIDEYGSGALGQGKMEITNTGTIDLDGEGTIGIFADNNNSSSTIADSLISNTGTITVGKSNISNTSIGIYTKKSTIANTGTINTGEDGIGIYADSGSTITDIGTIALKKDAIGVFVSSDSNLTGTTATFTSDGSTDDKTKTGFVFSGTGSENKSVAITTDASSIDNFNLFRADDINFTSSGDISVGTKGTGIYLDKGTAENTGTITLASGKTESTGMYTSDGTLTNTGIINIESASVGMRGNGVDAITNVNGNINLNADSGIGVYIENKASTNYSTNINLNAKNGIGILADDSTVTMSNTITHNRPNEDKNIMIYAKNGSTITNNGILNVDGVSAPTTANNKSIGIYLDNTLATNTYTGSGSVSVSNEAIGIYSKGSSDLNLDVTSTGSKTTGVYFNNTTATPSKVSGVVNVNDPGSVGIYSSEGEIEINTGGLNLNLKDESGSGLYLSDGSYATGEKITITNTYSPPPLPTLPTYSLGLGYVKGTGTTAITNSAELELNSDYIIGISAYDGVELVNDAAITATNRQNIVGVYVIGDSKYTNNSNITISGEENAGAFVKGGEFNNTGIIKVDGNTIGRAAGLAGDLTFTNTITNSGTIEVSNGVGVFASDQTTFDGTGGTLKVSDKGIALYVYNNNGSKISETGSFDLSELSTAVYGDNSSIDFDIDLGSTNDNKQVTGLVAEDNTVISSTITVGDGNISTRVLDETVSFTNTSKIIAGDNNSGTGAAAIGLLIDKNTNAYTLDNLDIEVGNGVGIYLDNDSTDGVDLSLRGNIETTGGSGAYVGNNSTLTTNDSTFNINSGTGIYLNGGTLNLGTTGETVTLNLTGTNSTGVYSNSGTVNFGTDLNVTGSGALLATKDNDLTLGSSINIGEDLIGVFGAYTAATTVSKEVLNNPTINASSGGIGMAVEFEDGSTPTGNVTVTNSGTINVGGASSLGKSSVGIYSEGADVVNNGDINVANKGVAIYYDGEIAGDITNSTNTINLNSTEGTGIYVTGDINTVDTGRITSTTTNNVGVFLDNSSPTTTTATDINLGEESLGIGLVGSTTTIGGSIQIDNGSSTRASVAIGGINSNITTTSPLTISTGDNSVAFYLSQSDLILNNADNLSIGNNSVYIFSEDSSSVTLNDSLDVSSGEIGILSKNNSAISILAGEKINVSNGGVGVYYDTYTSSLANNYTVALNSPGPSTGYSIGTYYKDISDISTTITTEYNSSNVIGSVSNNSIGGLGGIRLDNIAYTDQIGVVVEDSSIISIAGDIITNGNKKFGVISKDSTLSVTGDLTIGTSSNSTNASIGSYIENTVYTGTGDLSIGNNSVGIYAKDNTSILQTGEISLNENSLGIYVDNTTSGSSLTHNGTNIAIDGSKSIALYGNNVDMNIATTNISIDADSSLGVVSRGTGDVILNSSINIANNSGVDRSSVGVFKDGSGTLTTSTDSWNVGNKSYGIYSKQSDSSIATINNSANMTLNASSIGIYSSGSNIVNNSGDLTVGETTSSNDNNLNSIGIYGANGSTINNSGTINVEKELSIGGYVTGSGTNFINNSTINVDYGGSGIVAENDAIATNNGIINTGSNLGLGGTATTAMGAYSGGTIINNNSGTINVNEGVGMLVNQGSSLKNYGTINVNNGYGIQGAGSVVNSGTINVTGSGVASDTSSSSSTFGSVNITSDGDIYIDNNYTAIGGTLKTDSNLYVDGAYVDITTNIPVFEAPSVSGNVNILPNFASTGNGVTYRFEDFIKTIQGGGTTTSITPITSPLFMARVDNDSDLIVVKRPYKDLTIGSQFDNLENGLDNVLAKSPDGDDGLALKSLNEYLGGVELSNFSSETSKMLSETRGDIYTNIEKRMKDIDKAYNESFDYMAGDSPMDTKSSQIYVLYNTGNYDDESTGIPDYDYNLKGFNFMQDLYKPSINNKMGYTIGFTETKFNFEDSDSNEDVYTIKLGLYDIYDIAPTTRFTSKFDFGYNRHKAERYINLNKTYVNDADYNSYSVSFNNNLIHELYASDRSNIEVYGGLDLTYEHISQFSEDSGVLELKVDSNNYFDQKFKTGIEGNHKYFLANSYLINLNSGIEYSYTFNSDYDNQQAKLKNGDTPYYDLALPLEEDGVLTAKIGISLEQSDSYKISMEMKALFDENKDNTSYNYGVSFNYKFD